MNFDRLLKYLRYHNYKILYYKHEVFYSDEHGNNNDGFAFEIKVRKDNKELDIKYYRKSYSGRHYLEINDKKMIGKKSQQKIIEAIENYIEQNN